MDSTRTYVAHAKSNAAFSVKGCLRIQHATPNECDCTGSSVLAEYFGRISSSFWGVSFH
jgi:hypothetical protein